MPKNVRFEPNFNSKQTKVKINYSGLLADAGAEEIYLHAGVGSQHDWDSPTDIKMKPAPEENSWTAELSLETATTVNFCFKDSADNWDNNSGYDWSYQLLH